MANEDFLVMRRTQLAAILALVATAAHGANNSAALTLKDHRFTPTEIHVKANTPSTVSLTNNDNESEEFDSTSLKIEKVVSGHELVHFNSSTIAANGRGWSDSATTSRESKGRA